jgi:subtilisin family serine protease
LENRQRADYVEDEIIVKFKAGAAQEIERGLKSGGSWQQVEFSGTLSALKNKFKVTGAEPVFTNFRENRAKTKALLEKDKTLLTKKERRLVARLARAPKGAVVPDLGRTYKLKLVLEKGQRIEDAATAYSRDNNVEYAELNYIVRADLTPSDALYPLQWALNNTGQMYPASGRYNQPPGTADSDIDAPEAWNINTGSLDVVVAVIDTGVDYEHRDLRNNMWVNEAELSGAAGVDDDGNGYIDDIYGFSFVYYSSDPRDDNGHGTHCAGIISAEGNNGLDISGVCPRARIMAIKAMDWSGQGTLSDCVAAFYYAADNGADVTSNSWGSSFYSETMREAVDYVHSQGVVTVAAAGNSGTDMLHYPAGYENVFAVAATNSNDEPAPFTNYGDWVDIAAPGVDILSLRANATSLGTVYDAYTTVLSGTSMACPHASGACALLLATNPTLINADVYDILVETADAVVPGLCRSDGRLNLYAAALSAVLSKGRIHLDSDFYKCSDEVSISLGDSDLAGTGSWSVALTSSGGDAEEVVLTEAEPAVGFFAGIVSADAGEPNVADGVLQVNHGDIITVTYNDANDGTGNPAVATDIATVDCHGPVIVRMEIDPVGPAPRVSFETDEVSRARVLCGFGCAEPCDITASDLVLATKHEVWITGVSQATDYYFVIELNDILGNATVDDNEGNCYWFRTDEEPGDIYVPLQDATIQQAVDHCWDGGSVWVADGTYKGQGNRDIDFRGKAITVRSRNGPDECIIDCEGFYTDQPHRGFDFHSGEDANSVLDGFTITGGLEYWYPPYDIGAAVRCFGSSPTIRNCIFTDNSSGGGAVGSINSNPLVTGCKFANNDGPGMINDGSSPTVIGCEFVGNWASDNYGGAGMDNRYDSSPTVVNCNFLGNFIGSYGGGMFNYDRSHPNVINCTFSGNHAGRKIYPSDKGDGGGMYNGDGCRPKVANCIFWGNTDADGNDQSAQISGGVPVISYSCIEHLTGSLGGTGNIGANPLFIGPGHWDDNGTPNYTGDDSWVDGRYYLSAGRSPCIDAGDNTQVPAFVTKDFDGWPRFLDDPNVIDSGWGTAPIVDMGVYEHRGRQNIYVDDDAPADPAPGNPDVSDPLEDGSAEHPFDGITEAVEWARDGDTVIVARGLYKENVAFRGMNITVRSTEPTDANVISDLSAVADTVIDANGLGSAVSFFSGEGTECVLTGFTIRGSGSEFGDAGVLVIGRETRPTIRNCIIKNNDGDGVFCFDWPQGSKPTISNCVIAGNEGSAIETWGSDSASVVSCTIVGNGEGGVRGNMGGPTVANCIVWDNAGSQVLSNGAVVRYSDIEGEYDGRGNIDIDPCFIEAGHWDSNGAWVDGDYHLGDGSSCINAGDPNHPYVSGETDLDGVSRILAGRIDIGAYEKVILNSTPVACIAGGDRSIEATGAATKVTLDGSCSYDVDSAPGTSNDIVSFEWYRVDACDSSLRDFLGSGETLDCNLAIGQYLISLEVTDREGASGSAQVRITVEDTTGPQFILTVAPTILWPPDRKMVAISVSWMVQDNYDAHPDVLLTGVTMNEVGDADDIVIDDEETVYLRAACNGRDGARVYTLSYEAVDMFGNSTAANATVTVPRDRRLSGRK